MVGVWTPGMTPRFYPRGIGLRVPKTVDLVLQLHSASDGKPETGTIQNCFVLSGDKPANEVRRQEMLLLGSLAIDIPAGKNYHAVGSCAYASHSCHPSQRVPSSSPDRQGDEGDGHTTEWRNHPSIWIKDWNFYWQDSYLYQQPVRLPKGTRIQVEAAYNNSPENPLNPSSPPKRVLFGNGSTDEMCFAFFQIVTDEPKAMMRIAPSLLQSFLVDGRKQRSTTKHEKRSSMRQVNSLAGEARKCSAACLCVQKNKNDKS